MVQSSRALGANFRARFSSKSFYGRNNNIYTNVSMAKLRSRKRDSSSKAQTTNSSGAEAQTRNYDPALISLFAQSVSTLRIWRPGFPKVLTLLQLGAVKTATRPIPWSASHPTTNSAAEASKSSSDAQAEELGLPPEQPIEQVQADSLDTGCPEASMFGNDASQHSSRKRKRQGAEYDLESRYMSQLAREEAKENQSRGRVPRNKVRKPKLQGVSDAVVGSPDGDGGPSPDSSAVMGGEEASTVGNVPQHESLSVSRADSDLEKSSRTVFLANVSTDAIKSKKAKKALMDHLASFTSSRNGGQIIESFRFRSTAFAARGMPKKAAFAKKELMDTTTKSTNAYVVYTTQLAARKAVINLNGSVVLDRHLRVDSVAHPAKVDHRRCVFIGNLGFVDEEISIEAAQEEEMNKRPRKAKEPADAEEGLWRQFGKAGIVESVRIVRDRT